MSIQSITWRELLGQAPTFPKELREHLLAILPQVANQKSSVRKRLPILLRNASYRVDEDAEVLPTRFTIDGVIKSDGFLVACEVEEGKSARIELDLLKLTAFGKRTTEGLPVYGCLIVSDQPLQRRIVGRSDEAAFSYVKRVLRLLDLPHSGLDDLLIVESPTSEKPS